MIHLHVHTEYSQLDGLGSPDRYCRQANELGFKSLAITDHANIDGVIQFQKACLQYGLQPIFGCEFYVVPNISVRPVKENRFHLTCLIQNQVGWDNICRLLTKANLDGFYRRPRVDFKLLSECSDGLIFLSGCSFSVLHCEEGLKWISSVASQPGRFFFEVMPHNIDRQKLTNSLCLELNMQYKNAKLVATNDCHYVLAGDSRAHEVLLAIQSNAKWHDKNRWKFEVDGLYLRTEDEMRAAFHHQGVLSKKQVHMALENTDAFSELCKFRIEKRAPCLPDIAGGLSESSDLLERLVFERAKDLRYDANYLARLKEELVVIRDRGFSGYFLIVHDLVEWCKENQIFTGVGRGSVGGSLVAYTLGITSVDPIKHGLIFSRFLTKDRIDYPDIDMDFEHSKREFVIKYLSKKYGADCVATISTFIRLKPKAVIRDVMRVFGYSPSEINDVSKNIETLDDLSSVRFTRVPDILEIARALEGTIKSSGQHAAGMIISSVPFESSGAGSISLRKGRPCLNWDMNDCEHMGLIKFDILGLDVLTVLNLAQGKIKNKVDSFELKAIPLDDKEIFKQFSKGNTAGVFQFSGAGMSTFLMELQPACFEDLSAANALYRPGTLRSGMIDVYLDRKFGRKGFSDLPEKFLNITRSTYGVLVYQEQIMQVAMDIARFSSEKADRLRKVIAKSKGKGEINKFMDEFISGCMLAGYSRNEAGKLWGDIVAFSEYGFNKAHAVAYTLIGYWCMWLKVYYPVEFLLSAMTVAVGMEDKISVLVEEAKRLGFQVSVPRAEISDSVEWVFRDGCFYAPIIAVKGIGEKEALKFRKKFGFFISARTKKEILLREAGFYGGEYNKALFGFEPSKILGKESYPKLIQLRDFFVCDIESVLKGEFPPEFDGGLIQRKRLPSEDYLHCMQCAQCSLRAQAKSPVPTSKGLYNVFIVGEAPGEIEDAEGLSFVGRAGELLWNTLRGYSLYRRFFHVGNCVRCFPSIDKTPNKTQIGLCSQKIIREAVSVDCRLVLAFGNTALKAFLGKDSGINSMSGECRWIEKYGFWVVFCTHPAGALRNNENMKYFEKGVLSFSEKFMRLL